MPPLLQYQRLQTKTGIQNRIWDMSTFTDKILKDFTYLADTKDQKLMVPIAYGKNSYWAYHKTQF